MSFPDLITPVSDYRTRQYHNAPCHTNRASNLAGDCERQLVYERTRWQDKTPPDPGLITIFAEGNAHEQMVLEELRRAGVTVLEQQTTLEWRAIQVTGHIDAVVIASGNESESGTAVPVDVKSMSGHIWDSCFPRGTAIYSWDDVADAFTRKHWLRKYRGQIMLYCLLKEADRGILLCKNKNTGQLAQVNLELDYEYAESLVRRAERLNAHVADGTLPERIAWDADVCGGCPYLHICLPDHVGRDPIAFVAEGEIEDLLTERENAEAEAWHYKAADERVKRWMKAQEADRVVVGDWLLERKNQRNGVRVEITRVA